ncbi:hypothetical protein NC653_002444 [Populus alba x Populus x berolinensis]|uniref:Uncharacterized protein n=1 Tax=Populus alba x Populus x berolinensis TaxID=444605 RepID=A0AAD6RP58_9ROSI|nr:hypothetical protein NC653_002444 [Populus alba x Populus x berolinensis]
MAKHKRKAIAAATHGKATLHDPTPDNPDHARSIVLAIKALSSSSFPPLASAVCSSVLKPIPEAAPSPVSLDDVTVDDCSEDDALAGDLLDEEQLDLSFTDDDYLFSTSKQSSPCTKLQNFSLNHLTKTCAISPEDFQPQFEVMCNRFSSEEDKSYILRRGPYQVYGRPLILKPMTKYFDFSSEEMTRASKVVYEALPKFCNFCNVLGHTRILYPNAAASPPLAGITSPVNGKGSVFHRLGPQIPPSSKPRQGQPPSVQGPFKDSSIVTIVDSEPAPCDDASDGWIAVEPWRKSKKHISNSPKRKEVFAVTIVSAMSRRSDVPSNCAVVVNSLGAGTVVDAGVDLGATSSTVPLILGEDILATIPTDVPPLGEPVNHNGKLLIQRNHAGSRRIPPSPAPT